ncbi:hypothetical protein M422DRAFT_254990 [Sphaerobolus stellatus SS14]|uniref:Uncharacterized protein n=1 Tax=Sphaerobolus stellatus (strain SS14) TaxID=990650 RepID=A0A0C9V548_SPHS4|nr:hypothetical protein M422DRAFT_254990 [Sphaerobolus stellatus SS14]
MHTYIPNLNKETNLERDVKTLCRILELELENTTDPTKIAPILLFQMQLKSSIQLRNLRPYPFNKPPTLEQVLAIVIENLNVLNPEVQEDVLAAVGHLSALAS